MRRATLAAAVLAAVAAWPQTAAANAEAGQAPAIAQSGSVAAVRATGGDYHGRLKVFGLTTDQRLVSFNTSTPSTVRSIAQISGLVGDTSLVGIDFRVQNGLLYGVGNQGGIYTINTLNAVATKVHQLTVALSGTQFGVDFNPAANRLRIVSDTGQNLRHNIDDANAPLVTTVDAVLTHPSAAVALGITGAAYTNNDLDPATGTTLFDVDTVNDTVAVQSPANSGNLAPTGSLGVNAGPSAGFDIYYSAKNGNGNGYEGSNQGFATLQVDGVYRFHHVNLLTGAAQRVRSFPLNHQVTDIALPLAQKSTN
ncbi:DUF4394 domain-containing protein [Streptomyces sp. NPDC057445]|uniref:DUF4394 domain-containing protein n=1 Tax=Streptomyces sp. NPDC057445 TaxID=3346136 RepID=UPI0036873001